jgi:endonuclease/exonuclease/phosphatase family metal-dependent hydrolase
MNKRLAWSIFRYIISLLLVLALGLAVLLWWALGKNLPQRTELPLEITTDAKAWPIPEILSVASYNIGHGQGIKENAWDYRSEEVTKRQLSMVADAMVEIDADIFLLQEVDLDSHRTFRIDQIEFIKEKTKHPYHACAIVWEKNYLPFPYWPPAHHIGSVQAANCILSRFPLSDHQRIIFDKPSSNPFWYNWGYIDRGIQRVNVRIGEKNIALLNVHLEAWEIKAREQQIKITKEYIDEIDLPIILGGDFNTVMPDAEKKSGFKDEPDADYTDEITLDWFIKNVQNLKVPVISANDNELNQIYTFPSDSPDRRLDHIFLIGKSLSLLDFKVAYEAGLASDHLPVVARINY